MNDPFIISSIILSLTFLFLLILNNTLKNKLLKVIFLILAFIFLILIFIFDNNYIYELLKNIITYIWYPNYLLFVSTIIFSIILFIYTLLKNITFLEKIINYIFFCISFSCYITFLRLNIDLNSYTSYYTKGLVIPRIISITFIIWLFITIILKFLNRRQDEK